MNRNNEIMTVKGYYSDNSLKPIDQEQPFSDCVVPRHYGMPITPCAFLEMLYRFRDSPTAGQDPFKNVWWVEFSKASIFRILAQEECDYIRFYFAIPDAEKDEASLLLHGVDHDHKTIKAEILLDVSEKMNQQTAAHPGEKLNESTILNSLASPAPPTEEKGNGGFGFPINGEKNVKSMSDFLESAGPFAEMDIHNFTKEFFAYADKQF
ncbi:MAG: hypothetical protein ABI419_04310 [Ginsengibacter sp.]